MTSATSCRETTPAQTFTVTNTGGVATGTIATSVTGTDPGQFPKSADNCNGQTLGARELHGRRRVRADEHGGQERELEATATRVGRRRRR